MSDVNSIGLPISTYQGAKSTLCVGCGHDSVTQHIIKAYYQSGVHPFNVAKISGIGCSSKTTNYFMNPSHGFNSIHGRMAAVATGAKVANKNLNIIGISGDGDTASIGIGGFIHLLRRNVPMVYIVENNGVYGLTKGQFSATADHDMIKKTGEKNPFHEIDLCALAIESGSSFVARSFSGDGKQLVALIDAAIRHNGTAFIDVISPCITYANHKGSTLSYDYVREHKVALQELGYIQPREPHTLQSEPGSLSQIPMADGSTLLLRKLEEGFDVSRADLALTRLHAARKKAEILTGLFYFNPQATSAMESLQILSDKPLTELSEVELRANIEEFKQVINEFS
jgi:2-oxoglutarate ferredoxin oxidoreductase subunit beta